MSLILHSFLTAGLRQLVAALCLVAYLLMGTPLAPVAAAVIASFDAEHRVEISSDSAGMKVVLRHDFPALGAHSHCLVSSALVWLADASNAPTSDHVLNFQKGQFTTLRDSFQSVGLRVPLVSCLSLAAIPSRPWLGFPRVEAPLLAIPPPDWSVSVVRSTVFLI